MITKRIVFNLIIDDDRIADIYPNYNFSFKDLNQFSSFIKMSLLDGITENNLKDFGYTIEDNSDEN